MAPVIFHVVYSGEVLTDMASFILLFNQIFNFEQQARHASILRYARPTSYTHAHAHRSSTRTGPCTFDAVELLSSRRGVARVAWPLPHHLVCVWRSLPELTPLLHLPQALWFVQFAACLTEEQRTLTTTFVQGHRAKAEIRAVNQAYLWFAFIVIFSTFLTFKSWFSILWIWVVPFSMFYYTMVTPLSLPHRLSSRSRQP